MVPSAECKTKEEKKLKLKFTIISLNGEVFLVNSMQFDKSNCRVVHFGAINEQSSSETDWLSTVPHVSLQACERPHNLTSPVSSFIIAGKVSVGIQCLDLHLLLLKK